MDNSSTDEEVELCIKCGTETKYKENDHIDHRTGYIEGAGQLCSRCYYNIKFIQ